MDNSTFTTECDRRRSRGLILKGKTYEIKEDLKNSGAIWDYKLKAWLIATKLQLHAIGAIEKKNPEGGTYWLYLRKGERDKT